MKACLYIDSESLGFNGNEAQDETENRLNKFINDCIKFSKNGDEIFYFETIFNIEILPSFTIKRMYCSADKDTLIRLGIFFDRCHVENNPISNILQEIAIESNPNAIFAFNKTHLSVHDPKIIYTQSDWFQFHRYFLSRFDIEPAQFIDDCSLYFPNLFFHEQNKISLRSIYKDCKKQIVKYLTALNDKLPRIRDEFNGKNRVEMLKNFSSVSGLGTETTLERNPSRKGCFTFYFPNDKNNKVSVCCEPHMKIYYDDLSSYSTNRRIYFHEGIENIQNGKILIGWIGTHL